MNHLHFYFLTSKAIRTVKMGLKSLMVVLQNHCEASTLTKAAEKARKGEYGWLSKLGECN